MIFGPEIVEIRGGFVGEDNRMKVCCMNVRRGALLLEPQGSGLRTIQLLLLSQLDLWW